MSKAGSSQQWTIKDKNVKPNTYYIHAQHRRRPRWLIRFLFLACIAFIAGTYLPLVIYYKHTPNQNTVNEHHVADPAQQRLADSHRDQILLYRIIGNDLPPRHKEGQTLSNLQFILNHEPDFPNTRKLFVLNRIVDHTIETMIIRLLDKHGMEYIRIPFVEHDYLQVDFRLEDFPQPDFFHSDDYRRSSKVAKLRALDYTYHDKNIYAMNNNGGRNTALRHGRHYPKAKWIMPFDGNCFLTWNAFQEIRSQLERHGDAIKYFVVPMARLLNNSMLLESADERPKTPDEPQIIFRHDSTEEYNLNMRYGRRSKLELLWRLGALENRRLLNRMTVAWEVAERPYSEDKGNFRTIGWVFRLFSGNPQQEESKKEASSIRAFNRLLAIQASIDQLDETIARRNFQAERPFLFNMDGMLRTRFEYWRGEEHVLAIVQSLREQADEILADVSDLDQQHEVEKSGQSLATFSRNVTILTLTQYFVNEGAYGKVAADLIRHFLLQISTDHYDLTPEKKSQLLESDSNSHLLDFLSDQGYSFPTVSYLRSATTSHTLQSSWILRHLAGLNGRMDISPLLDCIRLLKKMRLLTHMEYLDLQAIASTLLEQLITSPAGIHVAQMSDHRGVFYDLQVTSLAAFTDDVRMLLRVANRCRMRIGKQFEEDGSQPYQTLHWQSRLDQISTKPSQSAKFRSQLHFETLNLQYWTMLSRVIQNSGIAKDLWVYTAKNQGRLSHAVATHLQAYAGRLATLPSADRQFAVSRLQPLMHLANTAFGDQMTEDPLIKSDQKWIIGALDTFGERWDVAQDVTDFDSTVTDTSLAEAMALIHDDQYTKQENVLPFWMISLA